MRRTIQITALLQVLTLLPKIHGWSTNVVVPSNKLSFHRTVLSAKTKRALQESLDTSTSNSNNADSLESAFQEQEENVEVIRGFTDEDFVGMDTTVGGVALALENVIVIQGKLDDNNKEVIPSDLIRYSRVTKLTGGGPKKIAGGYYAGNAETEFDVACQAANVAVKGLSSGSDSGACRVVICGGDELLLSDSLDAISALSNSITIEEFYSVSDSQFPNGAASVTVLPLSTENDDVILEYNGEWFALHKDDIVTAQE